ncbi:BTB/POZ domain-containing protein [Heracleum sosnowskyi]|uniref:BTB/POZ domain-containing protein n=1 Tax=Heracleum sosnowskyi TaxID=360622 RepID=A0AAD8NB41_9APIA|nr:BTB/POZ domain-containing protein [Heracleum sosnowskyi]
MASMKLGTKPEAFQRDGHTWQCTTELPSDVTIEIGEMSFHLHKFPLLSRSGLLAKQIGELPSGDGSVHVLQLCGLPGGAKAFELIAKFCYGVKIEITAVNIVVVRCAAEYLQMNEDIGEGNLIKHTEAFLNEIFGNWADTMEALETCEEVLQYAEELHIVRRCINSLAMKAFADSQLYNQTVSGYNDDKEIDSKIPRNGISSATNVQKLGDRWWYEDVSYLGLAFYKRFIQAVESVGMRPEKITGSLVAYAKRYIPLVKRRFKNANSAKAGNTVLTPSEADQRALLEEIVELLPCQKGVVQTKFLGRLLRAAMLLQASPSCRESLEKRLGAQLDLASLDDLQIPNLGCSVETLYDIDCFQRILDYFLSTEQISSLAYSPSTVEENQLAESSESLTAITMVSNLVDAYLADVAPDVNLKFPKFQSLGAAVPDYARPLSDGMYRAIDIYLKAHPWLTDLEREQICRLMNCQKLSLEACIHAAQNERLPLRVIVQVLFFEQLRLRTSISGWFYVSDNLENLQAPLSLSKHDGPHQVGAGCMDDMKERVMELEKDCQGMKQEFQKWVKKKRRWSFFGKWKSQKCRNL